jgi:TonB family protein
MRRILICLLSAFSSFCYAGGDTLNLITKTEPRPNGLTVTYQLDKVTNKKSGSYILRDEKGICTDGHYKNGLKDGEWKFYYSKDSLMAKGNYSNGKKNGEWISYQKGGKPVTRIHYVNGEKGEEYVTFYPNGNKAEEGIPGLVTKYFKSGKVQEEIHMRDGKQNGAARRYYETGALFETRTMKDGERDSIYLFYYEDGTVWEHLLYRNGGIWNVLAYNASDGKAINCCTIKDGNGIMRFYDREGKLADESEYRNTMRNGAVKSYTKGVLRYMGVYKDNKREGPWKFYSEDGDLTEECTYVSGKKEGEIHYYYKKGALSGQGNVQNGLGEGEWRYFYESGKTKSILNFSKDSLNGPAQYFRDGKLYRSGNYLQDDKVGTWISYDAEGKETSREEFGDGDVDPRDKLFAEIKAMANAEVVFSFAEKQPAFPGGEKALMEFLKTNIKYPKRAQRNRVHGTVYISFVVTKTGEVTEAKVIRSVDEDLDTETLRVINSMPRWEPGTMNGKKVNVQYTLPVTFSL